MADAGKQERKAAKAQGRKGAGRGGPYRNGRRWWGNFDAYADVGGKREPLIPEGAKVATDDYQLALALFVKRKTELEQRRRQGAYIGIQSTISPAEYATRWLERLEARRGTDGRPVHDAADLEKRKYGVSTCLSMPVFRSIKHLSAVNRGHMSQLIAEMHKVARTKRGEPFAPSTIRNHLMWLSAMLTRAHFDGIIREHPLREHPDIPPMVRDRALDRDAYLDRSEVRRFLEHVLPTPRSRWAIEQAYVLAYTGCRRNEMLGMLADDLDFEAKRVWFREYDHRAIKGSAKKREVPMWPPLEAVLRAYLARTPRRQGELLFPSAVTGGAKTLEAQMMGALRKTLNSAARRAGITKPLGHHTFRHSYITARRAMQELDVVGRRIPVRDEVIVREVGHATVALIESTYGHVAKESVSQTLLDFGEAPPDYKERLERWRQEFRAAVKEGWKTRRQRGKDVTRLEAAGRAGRQQDAESAGFAAD